MEKEVKKFPQQTRSDNYKWYVLFLLTGVSTFSFIDRQLVAILQESIKAEMNLSDSQLGFLTGFAFSIFYAVFSIPVAHLADRYNRRNIIAGALTLWSGITALTGLAQNYSQMLIARIGVGIGETGSAAPSYSIIADYFKSGERAVAYSIYGIGIYLGLLFGFLIGGFMADSYGWRMAFFVVGLPGLLFGLLIMLTLKEPIRGQVDSNIKQKDQSSDPGEFDAIQSERSYSILEAFQILLSKRSFVLMTIAACCHAFVGLSYANWMPSFLIRIHDMSTAEVGIWLALAIGIFGALGTYLGGYWGDKYGKDDITQYLKIPAYAIVISFPFAMGVLFGPNKWIYLFSYMITNVLYAIYTGPCYAILQEMVDVRMRAVTSGIYLTIINLLGLGLGPLATGMLSDFYQPMYGESSIRWALFTIGFLDIIAMILLFRSTKYLKEDLVNP